MALGWPSLILLLFACKYATSSTSCILSPELKSFIPTCAQECFVSFIVSNFGSFPDEVCGETPSLDCLCTHNSTSGYTIGEGAVQCLISEDNIGFCQGNNASQSVVANAYSMCNGVQGALPETHGTITATLVVQTSAPSIVLVAPPTTSSSETSSTLYTTTSSTTTLPTASAVRTTSASSTASAQAATKPEPTTSTSLSKNQIIGISVGTVVGTAVFLGLAICVFCWRRRKQRKDRDSDSLPFQIEPPPHLRPKKKSFYNSRTRTPNPVIIGPGGTANGIAAKVSPHVPREPPPVPVRLENSDPLMFSRRSIRPDTIGMALSPDNKGSMEAQRRRASRLLPEKPTLKLKVPPSQEQQGNGLSFSQPITHPSGVGRQSTATQFEEDIDTADTAVNSDDNWGRTSSDGILNKSPGGRTALYSESEPEEPSLRPRQVPANGRADLYVEPLSIRTQGRNDFTQPRDVPPIPSQMPVAHLSTGDSSMYSGRRSEYSTDGLSRSNPRNSYRQAGPYDGEPFDSVVSPEDLEEPQRTGGLRTGGTTDLSPVMESPTSGRSPVSYPKIPEAISPTILRINYGPPPPQPNFTRALGSPPSQSQQPWRAAEIQAQQKRERIARQMAEAQARSPPRNIPPRAASANGHNRKRSREKVAVPDFPAPPRARGPDAQSQIPPSLRIITQDGAFVPPPRSRTAPLTDATGGWNYNPYISLYAQSQPQSQPRPQKRDQKQRPQPQPYQNQRTNSPKLNSTTTSSSNTIPSSQNPLMSPVWQPQPQHHEHEHQNQLQPHSHAQNNPPRSTSAMSTHSHTSQASKHSTSSSLLAKRLGEQKASKLALRTDEMNEGRKRQQAKWRVLDKEQQDRAKEGTWRPMLGRDPNTVDENERIEGVNGNWNWDGKVNSEVGVQYVGEELGQGREFERMDLPSTPGWVPKLTPTRRGDVLFLNVA